MVHIISLVDANDNPLQNDVVEETTKNTTTTTTKRRHFATSSNTQTLTSPPMAHGDSSHDPFPTLPYELNTEIISRLPVKILMQFKCINKPWKTLISDPQFARKHLSKVTSTHLILSFSNPSHEFIVKSYSLKSMFESTTPIPEELEYPLRTRNCYSLFVGSCDGILCFSIRGGGGVLLWNPAIRKYKMLPSSKPPKKNSYSRYGFGYDHCSDTYKVVAVYCNKCDNCGKFMSKTEAKVHTLGTDCWKRIQEFPSDFEIISRGKFVSGTLNWLAFNRVASNSSNWIVVSQDLGNESCQELSQPVYGINVVNLTLGVLRNCLCTLAYSGTFSDVWLMKDYGDNKSWAKLFRIPPYMEDVDSFPYSNVLCISEDEEVLLEYKSKKIVVYNIRNETFRNLEIQYLVNGWAIPHLHVESLISPFF
ncbi:hypothetical protein RIF29_40626 [Crotalaria pallida]|uniref:F-box domain-containing protein n=1 Tax=Crotalaria pallida TaxID=3830 RepID=A0AAN9HRV1_CROPI